MAFAEDYFEARAHFVAAAARGGLEVQTHWHPTALSPDGRPLAMDVVRAGRMDASHVLFTVSGTHGVEGYPGSAAQIQLIESGRLQSLPKHVSVVILHGLNPFGWSRDSQRNEDGIDVNRNFIDFSNIPESDEEVVARLAETLDIRELSYESMSNANQQLVELYDVIGGPRYMQAIAAGQYTHAKGFKYGGARASWSNQVYQKLIRCHLDQAEFVVELDWHTGLGAYGDTFPICFAAEGSEAFRKTCDWWGQQAVERGRASWSTSGTDAPSPNYQGTSSARLRQALPDAQVAGGIIEFGTLPISQIAMAVLLDHWLTFHAGDSEMISHWRAQMRLFMAPKDSGWERSVLKHAARILDRSLAGLIDWA